MTPKKELFHQNYESDFQMPFQFANGCPSYPWRLEFRTKNTPRGGEYVAEFDGKTYSNCRILRDDAVLVVFNDHRLGRGVLTYKLREAVPDTGFPDGTRDTTLPIVLPVELWEGPTDGTIPPETIVPGQNAVCLYLINLAKSEYPLVALQALAQMQQGKAVILCIRHDDGETLHSMTDVREFGNAYILSGAEINASQKNGLAKLERTQYLVSKASGKIRPLKAEILRDLLTAASVQDDLDGDAPDRPLSQRQGYRLRRMIEQLDGEAVKKDDILILVGNGVDDNENE
ncbi:MAG: hypothetical protein KHW63_05570 [Alistipes sp.]|nr:hypothetical protein [Alistipes sp.]